MIKVTPTEQLKLMLCRMLESTASYAIHKALIVQFSAQLKLLIVLNMLDWTVLQVPRSSLQTAIWAVETPTIYNSIFFLAIC